MEAPRLQRARDQAGDMIIAVAETLRDSVTHVVMERVTRPKYDDAVSVAMDTLENRIAALRTKPKPTVKDSQTIDLLVEVRTEMQAAFEVRWNNREWPEAH